MSGRARLVALAAVVAVFGATVFAQSRIDAHRAEEAGGALLYLPNERLLTHFTGGMSSVVANLLWLQCIQYIATQAHGAADFRWLNQMFNTVVRLDPHFVDAYRYGGLFLAALRADDDAALDLLHEGMVQNPYAWQLPYEAAMVYLLNRREQPDSRHMATFYLGMAARTGAAPPRIAMLAAQLHGEIDQLDMEREIWGAMLESEDQFLRDMAERKLHEVNLRETARVLTEAVQLYEGAHGTLPDSLQALVAADYLRYVPEDPLGGHFLIDPEGQVRSTTLLDDQRQQRLGNLRNALRIYEEQYGAFPGALEDLAAAGKVDEIPEHPYPGGAWDYDPVSGEVR